MPESDDGASAVGVAATIARITKGLTSEQQSFMLQRQGRIYLDQDDADAAIECFSRSISLFTSVANFMSRAQAYERNLDWSEAYYDYSFAIRLEPDNGILYGCRGMCLAKLKKFNIAIEDLTKCCQVRTFNHWRTKAILTILFSWNHCLLISTTEPQSALKPGATTKL
jgi:tetratricopeptide (TPR) repeat protein